MELATTAGCRCWATTLAPSPSSSSVCLHKGESSLGHSSPAVARLQGVSLPSPHHQRHSQWTVAPVFSQRQNSWWSLRASCVTTSTAIGSLPNVAAQAPASMQRPSSDTDVMGLLFRQRIVFLGFNIDEYVADAIISQLLLLDAQDPSTDIRLFINSPGGSTNSAIAIYDAIQLCRADVSTVAFGLAASTAAIVLAGGAKGKRLAMPNTRIMMHQPLAGASGQAIDVEIQAREAMHHRKNVARIFSEITGRPADEVEKFIDRDRYMSPAEAMEYGILDGLIDKDMIIPLCPSPLKA